jgi:O-antigen/teichoic acid export membrane protein
MAASLATAIAAMIFFRGCADSSTERPKLSSKSLLKFWVVDLLTGGLYFLPFVVLPYYATPSEVGQFGVAHRLVALGMISLSALASMFAPQFAGLHAGGDKTALRRSLHVSQKYALAVYLPLLVLFLVFGKQLLGVFGAEFRAAWVLLVIMGCGQLVNSATGLAQYLLYMTGREAWDLQAQGFTLIVSAVLMVVLGRAWGVAGIAAAYAVSVVVRSMVTFGLARREVGSISAH